jgi:hypothetical protein
MFPVREEEGEGGLLLFKGTYCHASGVPIGGFWIDNLIYWTL